MFTLVFRDRERTNKLVKCMVHEVIISTKKETKKVEGKAREQESEGSMWGEAAGRGTTKCKGPEAICLRGRPEVGKK